MNISYKVDHEDLELARAQDSEVTRAGRARLTVTLAVALILGWIALRAGMLVFYLAGLAVLLLFRFLRSRKGGGKGSAAAQGPGPRSLALDEGGLREQAGDAQRYVAWREVRAITSAQERTFVLLNGRRQPLVIPGRRIHGGEYDTFIRAMYEAYARHRIGGGR